MMARFKSHRSRIFLAVSLFVLLLSLAACGGQEAGAPAEQPTAADESSMQEMDMDGSGDMSGMAMEPLAQTEWEGMTISLASSPPAEHTVFQGSESRMITPTPEDSMHMMVVLADAETGERIPYSSVWLTIEDANGNVVFDERMWPMISRAMGTHYGINVPLPAAGTYDVSVQVGPPQVARHTEYTDRWQEPYTFETQLEWEGQE